MYLFSLSRLIGQESSSGRISLTLGFERRCNFVPNLDFFGAVVVVPLAECGMESGESVSGGALEDWECEVVLLLDLVLGPPDLAVCLLLTDGDPAGK